MIRNDTPHGRHYDFVRPEDRVPREQPSAQSIAVDFAIVAGVVVAALLVLCAPQVIGWLSRVFA